ncbi:major facilitator superfamily transporter [Seiridium cupressi]
MTNGDDEESTPQNGADAIAIRHDALADAENGKGPSTPSDEQQANSKPDPSAVTGLPLILLLVAVVLASLQMALNATVLGTAIPAITDAFHTIDDVGWYSAAYLISNCVMAPFTGKLFRLFPLKATFLTFIAIFNLGALLGGLSQSSTMLVVARATAGIGGSGILAGSIVCISAAVPIARRALLNGMLMGFFALGQAVGPLIGGALTTYASWRWCFYVNLPVGGVVVLFVGFVVKLPAIPSPDRNLPIFDKIRQIDLVGFFVFALANILLLMGLQWGGTKYTWNSSMVIGLICGGVVAFLATGCWFYHKSQNALIPTRLFKGRINLTISFTAFAQAGGTIIALYWYPIWFQSIKEASSMQSGVMLLPLILSQLFASVIGGGIIQKTGYYLPAIVLGNVLIAVGSALTTTLTPTADAGKWIGYQILLGAGRGFVLQILVTAMQANVPKADASIASTLVMFSQFFGGAIFSSVAKTVFTASVKPAIDNFAPDVDPALLINSGAAELQRIVPTDELHGVLLAYNQAIQHVFYLQLAAACCALIAGCGTGWRNLNRVDQSKNPDGSQAESREKTKTDV